MEIREQSYPLLTRPVPRAPGAAARTRHSAFPPAPAVGRVPCPDGECTPRLSQPGPPLSVTAVRAFLRFPHLCWFWGALPLGPHGGTGARVVAAITGDSFALGQGDLRSCQPHSVENCLPDPAACWARGPCAVPRSPGGRPEHKARGHGAGPLATSSGQRPPLVRQVYRVLSCATLQPLPPRVRAARERAPRSASVRMTATPSGPAW